MMNYDEYSHGQLVSRIECLEIELSKAKLTLRDEFAKAALEPLIRDNIVNGLELTPIKVAQATYAMADFMLEARK